VVDFSFKIAKKNNRKFLRKEGIKMAAGSTVRW
jgi:hypothetical protein